MSYSCFIVDDETHAIEVLEDYIAEFPEFKLEAKFTNSIDALQQVNLRKPDVVFLDIDMPRLNGIDFFKLVTVTTKIVFTTASPDFAVDAFEKNAFDYLLKPITTERFRKCITKLLNYQGGLLPVQQDFFYIKGENKNKLIKINFEDITYIEANNNYVIINLIDEKREAYLTLTEITKTLPTNIFYRINKSFVINYHRINYISGNQVILKDKTVLQIGNTYKEQFLKFINNNSVIRAKNGISNNHKF